MKIDINTIQVKPQNPAEFVAFLENYGFDWNCDKEQISPNDYPWIILYLDTKDIGGNEYMRELENCLTMPEDYCKPFVESHFQKQELVVKIGDIIANNKNEYIVALVASDNVKLICLNSGNRFDDIDYKPEGMFSEIPLKKLAGYRCSDFRIVKKGKGWA